MKSTMKKITASLLALLMMIQIVPALGSTYSSGMIVGGPEGYREALEIVASKGTFVLVGQTLALDVNEDYMPIWTSDNEAIATVDGLGLVNAIAPGTVTITAKDGNQSATAIVTVIDPEPLMAEAQAQAEAEAQAEAQAQTEEEVQPQPEEEAQTQPETEALPDAEPQAEPAVEPEVESETEAEPETEPEAEEEPEEEPAEKTPVQKEVIIIVVNAESCRYVFNGEEQTLNTFVATGNTDSFDENKVRVNGEIGVSATNCGTYEFKLDASAFSYDDKNVIATFVVNNGWMKITPAQVTVSANPATKQAGETDPELTASVEGLYGEDTVEYTFDRAPGEEPGEYVIDVTGEKKQGNYKVQYIPSVMTITEPPAAPEPLSVWITSLHPADQPVEYGMGITLVAQVTGAEEGEYAIQWQYSADYQNWIDIPGANDLEYTFIADGDTVTYAWRAVADRIQ